MFRHNPNANYQPNGGRYLQILSGKDLYKQTIVVSSKDTFPAKFPNIFVEYPLGQMRVGNKLWTNWNKAPLRLWQLQLNFAVWCASSACGVSSAHLIYKLRIFKICEDYGVPNDPMRYRDEKFYWTYQRGVC